MFNYPAMAMLLTLIGLCAWAIYYSIEMRPLARFEHSRNDLQRGAACIGFGCGLVLIGPGVALPFFFIFSGVWLGMWASHWAYNHTRAWRFYFDIALDWAAIAAAVATLGWLTTLSAGQ